MGPFVPGKAATTLVTVGLAAATIPVVAGRQLVLKAANSNSDLVFYDFDSSTTPTCAIPVAGGAKGGNPLGPGDMVEITVPSGQYPSTVANAFGAFPPFVATALSHISATAAQRLFITEGADC